MAVSLIRFVQKLDPVHRQGDSGEILFHLSFQKVGPPLVQDVAEPVVHFRKQNRLIDACGVLEGDKLHGIAVLCLNRLAGDQPSDGGDMLTEVFEGSGNLVSSILFFFLHHPFVQMRALAGFAGRGPGQ
jgi:hypothetical protein